MGFQDKHNMCVLKDLRCSLKSTHSRLNSRKRANIKGNLSSSTRLNILKTSKSSLPLSFTNLSTNIPLLEGLLLPPNRRHLLLVLIHLFHLPLLILPLHLLLIFSHLYSYPPCNLLLLTWKRWGYCLNNMCD